MSTQSELSVPLISQPSSEGFRLIELPPDLLALLESDEPPVLSITPSPTAALLKLDSPNGNKVWSLRQKNTSNALVLLSVTESSTSEPASSPGEDSHDDDHNQSVETYTPNVAAISTLHETIELVAEESNSAAPAVAAKGKWHERFSKSK